jgi:hypothetical protein
MIYMYGLPGKKAYTKLDDILKVRTISIHEKHGFDVFKNNVDKQVKQFHILQADKRNKFNLASKNVLI